jgi:putative oxidoreductase
MKYLPIVAGVILGLLFVMTSVTFFFHLVPVPPMQEGSPQAMFMGAVGLTGYMHMVMFFQFLGGILVAIPRTRNFGLLVLGPILINILAYHTFIMKGEGLANPLLIIPVLLALYLLWVGRKRFAGLLNETSSQQKPGE